MIYLTSGDFFGSLQKIHSLCTEATCAFKEDGADIFLPLNIAKNLGHYYKKIQRESAKQIKKKRQTSRPELLRNTLEFRPNLYSYFQFNTGGFSNQE